LNYNSNGVNLSELDKSITLSVRDAHL